MKEYLESTDSDWFKQRLSGVVLCVLVAFGVLGLRLFFLQIVDGEEYRRLSQSNCIRLQTIDPPRGMVFDRNETLLVDNRPSFELSIVPKDARPLKDTLTRLSRYVSFNPELVLAKFAESRGLSSYKPFLIKHDIGRNSLAAVEAHRYDLPGVQVDVKSRRNYLHPGCAAHMIGYISEINAEELKRFKSGGYRVGDMLGKFGIEKAYESYLRGEQGGRQVEVNARGQVVRVLKTVEAQPGHNLYLSIDYRLQRLAESLLEGVAGSVAAMEPATGQVLALASTPSFDQNAFASGMTRRQWASLISNPFRAMENKVLQGEYPPASTYKIITAIAGLEEGIIDENSVVYCPGHYTYGDRTFRCWRKQGHGNVNIVEALAQSCDVFFYQVGQKVGVDRLAWYATACGFGKPTGIDLDHEASGLIPTAAWKKRRFGVSWQGGETLSVAIGQGYNLTTPLQVLALTAAVANGGTLYKPMILKEIRDSDHKLVQKNRLQVNGKIPVNPENLQLIRQGLRAVVNGPKGTARSAKLAQFTVSGKTGTAQVVSRTDDELPEKSRAEHLKPHAWFIAYAPEQSPRIAVVIMVEHGVQGSSMAPIARELIRAYLTGSYPIDDAMIVARD